MDSRAALDPSDLISACGSLERWHQPAYPINRGSDSRGYAVTVAACAQQKAKLRENLCFCQPSSEPQTDGCIAQRFVLADALLDASRARGKRAHVAAALGYPVHRDVLVCAEPQGLSRNLSKAVQHDLSDFANRIALLRLILCGDFELITGASDSCALRYYVKRLPPVVF